MSKHFMGSANSIIVATNLDDTFNHLRSDAEALAKRTGMRVRFVHAVEPVAGGAAYRTLANLRELEGVLDAVEESRQLKAQQQIAETLGSNVRDDDVSVLQGDPVDAILAEATCSKASVIVVGASANNYKFVPRGFSTALRLMTHSNIPVIVSPKGGNHDLSKSRLRMLVADDLSNDGLDVVISALDTARALGNTDVLHLHVSTLSEEKIRNLITQSSAHVGDTPEIATLIQKNQEQAMAKRAPERIPLLEGRGGTYRHEIVSGDPIEQITHAAENFEADILVFGRHRTFHKFHDKPFSIGKVPFYSMLQQNRLVMIVPPRYHG